MSAPKISVITVCYNAAAVIEQTILSIVNQAYTNIEYIIIDGNSSDGTVDIIKKYADRITSWVSEPDKGVYDAMNKGIEKATGDWIYFIGAGDLLLNILDKLAPQLTETNTIYYGNVYRNDLQRVYDGKYPGYRLAVTNICHQAMFYPRSALKKYRYNTNYKLLADHDLNMRCYGDKNLRFEYLPMLIAIYEGDGISAAAADHHFFMDKLVRVKENFPYPIYLYAFLRRKIAGLIKR